MITVCIDDQNSTLLRVAFPPDSTGNDLIRNIPGRRWSYSRRCWVVPNCRSSIVHIGKLFGKAYCRFDEAIVRLYKPTATPVDIEQATTPMWPPAGWPPAEVTQKQSTFHNAPPLSAYDQHPAVVGLCETLRVQNYSYKTLKNYKQALIALIRYAGSKSIDNLPRPDFMRYLLFLTEKKRFSSSTLNVHINAYKFYRKNVLQHDTEFYAIDLPRQPAKLPTVYSVAEVKTIFANTTSIKYQTLFKLVYATGLRLSEVASLRLSDLDHDRRLINVRCGKGKKDRVVMLTSKLATAISEYLTCHHPKIYLFEGTDNNEPLHIRTIQQVYSDTVRFGGIRKKGGIHTLRHSFATHLLESGTDVRYI